MRVEFTPSFTEQYKATIACMRHSAIQLVAGLAFPAMGLALIAVIVLVAGRPPTWYEFLVFLACLAFTPAITALNVWLFRRKNRTVEGVHVVSVDDTGVRVAAPTFETLLRWKAIRRVVETSRFFLFFISPRHAQYVPKRAMEDDEMRTLRQLVDEHAGT